MRRLQYGKKTGIVLIDDNYEHLMGIKELLGLECNLEVVGIAANVNAGLNIIRKAEPDIVITDMNMPEKDGLTTIQEINRLNLNTKVIALTAYDDTELIYRAMKVGAKGYVLKTMASAQLIRAIEEVSSGKIYLPPALSTKFFEHFQKSFKNENKTTKIEDSLLSDLTTREDEVLDLLTQGNTYKDVAKELFISETTVKTHVNNIFQKLQVRDRTQAVLYALNHGFVSKRKVHGVI